ncbi:MAG: hypothetical protein HZA32_16290 [Opitutae bacterium]|nr:hypothetical protein [Opitutae bacterium]
MEQLVKTAAQNESGVAPVATGRLQRFRSELADLAFALERRGRIDAADVVNAIAARVAEIEAELAVTAEPGAT